MSNLIETYTLLRRIKWKNVDVDKMQYGRQNLGSKLQKGGCI